MKIEVGKTYLTRDGQKARVICTDKKGKSGRSVVVLVLESKDNEYSITLYSNGAVYTGETSDLDLISEYKEPPQDCSVFQRVRRWTILRLPHPRTCRRERE